MTCSKCGKQIRTDLMRCLACGYDMLPVDITQSSLENKIAPAQSARAAATAMFTRADSPFRVASWTSGVEGAELSELKRRAALHRWRLIVFLAVIVAIELFLSVVR